MAAPDLLTLGTARFRRVPAVAGAAIGSLGAAFGAQTALLVSGILAARILGPEDRGHFGLLTLTAGIIAVLVVFGLNTGASFYLAKRPKRAASIVAAVLPAAILQIVLGTLLQGVVVGVLIQNQLDGHRLAAVISIAVVSLSIVQQYAISFLQGLQRFRILNLVRVLPAALNSIFLVVAVALGLRTLLAITCAWVIANLLSALVMLAAALSAVAEDESTEPPIGYGQVARFGAKGFLGSATPLETFRLDQMVVALFLTPASLGIYIASLAFTNLPRFISQSLGMVAYPYVASIPSKKVARHRMWQFFTVTVVTSGLFVAVLAASAGDLVPFVFGEEFRQSVTPTRILLLVAFLQSARRILSDGLRGLGYPGKGSSAEIASWIVLIPSILFLAPRWQLNGVAVALGLSASVSFGVVFLRAIRLGTSGRREGLSETML